MRQHPKKRVCCLDSPFHSFNEETTGCFYSKNTEKPRHHEVKAHCLGLRLDGQGAPGGLHVASVRVSDDSLP